MYLFLIENPKYETTAHLIQLSLYLKPFAIAAIS